MITQIIFKIGKKLKEKAITKAQKDIAKKKNISRSFTNTKDAKAFLK